MKRHNAIISKYEILHEEEAVCNDRHITITVIESEATCPAPQPICMRYLLLSGQFPDLLFEGGEHTGHPKVAGHEIHYGDFHIGFDCKADEVTVNGRIEQLGDIARPTGLEFGLDGYVGLI